MKRFFKNNSYLFLLIPTVITFFSLYSNCSQQDNPAKTVHSLDKLDKLQQDYLNYTKNEVPTELSCYSSNDYFCEVREFAPKKIEKIDDRNFCLTLSNNKEICVTIKTLQFDTTSTIENCDNCDGDEINERYYNSEIMCYHKQFIHLGQYIVRDHSSLTINESIQKVFNQCESIIKASNK